MCREGIDVTVLADVIHHDRVAGIDSHLVPNLIEVRILGFLV